MRTNRQSLPMVCTAFWQRKGKRKEEKKRKAMTKKKRCLRHAFNERLIYFQNKMYQSWILLRNGAQTLSYVCFSEISFDALHLTSSDKLSTFPVFASCSNSFSFSLFHTYVNIQFYEMKSWFIWNSYYNSFTFMILNDTKLFYSN